MVCACVCEWVCGMCVCVCVCVFKFVLTVECGITMTLRIIPSSSGFWETLTYGLFGMFKSDWTAFGGFDTQKYKFKWGGEDWDLLDK